LGAAAQRSGGRELLSFAIRIMAGYGTWPACASPQSRHGALPALRPQASVSATVA
jgi:hypothetical protein